MLIRRMAPERGVQSGPLIEALDVVEDGKPRLRACPEAVVIQPFDCRRKIWLRFGAVSRPNYGIDAPGVVTRLALVGIACVAAAIAFHVYALVWSGATLIVTAALMVVSSTWGKIRQREWLLDRVAWRGDERVLDAGCGRGLFLCAAARRVPDGRVIGVDLWQAQDQTGNSSVATRANAAAEGVADRIDVMGGDLRALPFRDGTFDVVVSSLVVHNIPDAAGRALALCELVRVLAPGGRLLVQDIAHTRRYAAVLREAQLASVRRGWPTIAMFPPTRPVEGIKQCSETEQKSRNMII